MKETSFIKQNIDKWNIYENELKKQKKDPETVSKLFVQITDDLAYAQTFYKSRSVKVYLNGIAQLLFNDINKRNKIKIGALLEFWTKDLPIILFKTRFELLFSFLIFALMIGIGVVTSVYKPGFAENILGERYVQMTIENIEKNDPMAVYKQQNGFDMFLGITLNNLLVAFVTFLLGLFFGFGTFFSLLRNGIMVGTFQYFFIERGLFKESFLTIWQHGTLEISAIIIAGGAGFTIGRGLILPGTYTRFQSLRLTARRGLKIMIGLIPVFVLAGFIEGFFTRYTDVPDIIRLITIMLSLAFVLFYFVFYPKKIARRYPEKLDVADKLNETDSGLPPFNRILSGELLFGGTLKLFKEHFGRIAKTFLLMSFVGSLILLVGYKAFFPNLSGALIEQSAVFKLFFGFKDSFLLYILNSLLFGAALYFSTFLMVKTKRKRFTVVRFFRKWPGFVLNPFILSLFVQCVFFLSTAWGVVFTILFLPFGTLVLYTSFKRKLFFLTAIRVTFSLLSKNFGKFLLLNLEFMFISTLILLLVNPSFYGQLLSFIHWNLWLEEQYINLVFNLIVSMVFFLSIYVCILILSVANSLLYYTLHEIHTSEHLLRAVNSIGSKKTLRGYELE